MMKTKLAITLLFAAFALVATSVARAQTHAFIWSSDDGMKDLGTLGGTTTAAHSINDSGQVAGESYLNDGVTLHLFIWSEATGMVDLGNLGGDYIIALGINSSGAITGQGTLQSGRLVAFYWSSSTGFVTFGQPGFQTNGNGINDANEITGQRYSASTADGFIWDPITGISRALGNVQGGISSNGTAINNFERITGVADLASGGHHVFSWTRRDGIRDLGSPNGPLDSPYPFAINDRDEIVGFSDGLTSRRAFYWSRPSGFRILQSLSGDPTSAQSINNAGNIAGYSPPPSTPLHAVLWFDSLSAPQDLGTLPGDITSNAEDINNLGQVVGESGG